MFSNWLLYFSFHKPEDYKSPFETKNMEVKDDDGHAFGWNPGVGDGQGGLACCRSWGHKESDMTEQLN